MILLWPTTRLGPFSCDTYYLYDNSAFILLCSCCEALIYGSYSWELLLDVLGTVVIIMRLMRKD